MLGIGVMPGFHSFGDESPHDDELIGMTKVACCSEVFGRDLEVTCPWWVGVIVLLMDWLLQDMVCVSHASRLAGETSLRWWR